jgi:hypothetical protein
VDAQTMMRGRIDSASEESPTVLDVVASVMKSFFQVLPRNVPQHSDDCTELRYLLAAVQQCMDTLTDFVQVRAFE